ncbi:hypothetical protein N9L92_05235, partial [Saprospiraceae bacterium]|nr:hypothetical protein [Saprospiraceae bacterium]
MNQLNNHEEEFKKVLEGISFDIDTSEVWRDIKGQLPLEKKKERKPFWLFFGVFAAALIGISMMFVSDQAEVNSISHNTTNLETNKNKTTIAESENYTINNIEDSREDGERKLNQGDNQVNTQEASSDLNQINNNSQNINSVTGLSDTPITSQSETINDNKSIASNKEIIVNNSTTVNKQVDAVNISDANVELTNSTLSIMSISDMISMIDINRSMPSLDMNFDNRIIPIVSNVDKAQLFTTVRVGSVFGISDNTLTDINSEFNTEKFNNESGRFGVSADLLAGIETPKGWKFFGGVSYVNEVYNYTNQSTENSSIEEEGVESVHIDANGVSNEISGPVTVNSTTAFDLSWHRRHQSIALAVGVAKRMRLCNRFSLEPEVSVLYNLSQQDSGYFFSEESGDIVKFNNGEL